MFTPEFLLQVLVGVGSAVGVYAGIKVDLAITYEKALSAENSANTAHNRIDKILDGKH